MKSFRLFVLPPLCFFAALLGGCVSAGSANTTATWSVIVSGGLDFGLSLAVPPVLDKNPLLATPLQTFATGISAAFGTGDLTPANVQATVTALGKQAGLDAATRQIIVDALNKGIGMYTKAFGVSVASATNANVLELLNGIAAGISNGVSSWQAKQPASPAAASFSPQPGSASYAALFPVTANPPLPPAQAPSNP